MKSLVKLTLVLLLSVVAFNETKESKAENVTEKVAANNGEVVVKTTQQGNDVIVASTEYETFKRNQIRTYVGATLTSNSGNIGAKAGVEFHRNLNKQNSVFVGLEGTYYIPGVDSSKVFGGHDAYESQKEQLSYSPYFGSIANFVVSEKYAGAITAGITMKFQNIFSFSPYLVAGISYGKMAYQGETMYKNVSYTETISTFWGEDYEFEHNDIVFDGFKVIEEEGKLFYKGGLGFKFAFGDRVFVDVRYQASQINVGKNANINYLKNGGKNWNHELTVSAGLYIF